ncbi:MAG: hypothetical protein L0322_15945 [Chloroflexi bacterium]|nr:hypothetical protein [Chloroflexota bacterium]MCI0644961.1 hypothetical protein [Chloroflexota bacterium]
MAGRLATSFGDLAGVCANEEAAGWAQDAEFRGGVEERQVPVWSRADEQLWFGRL